MRLLIIGCGDVALRTLPLLRPAYRRIYALTHSPERMAALRALGVIPLAGDLDRLASLNRLAGVANDVLHFAPPPNLGKRDTRTAHLLTALTRGGSLPHRLVYISTSGVYGNCRGEAVPETRPLMPQTERAQRRVDAEQRLRDWGKRHGVCVSILRVPGIYAENRLPLERLKAGTPALLPEHDAYTNLVHADDLAQMVLAALRRGQPNRAYNANDDSALKMGDYFDLVADRFDLPHPPRITWDEARQRIPPTLLSFMGESRRLINRRLQRELGVVLRYPTPIEGVAAAAGAKTK